MQKELFRRESSVHRKAYIAILGLGLLLIMALFAMETYKPAGKHIVKITGYDGAVYYSVAHSLLFDHDFDLRNQFFRLKPVEQDEIKIQPQTGLPGSPFPLGYSLLQIPFMALGHLVTKWVTGSSDGYHYINYCFFFVANIVFVCIGLMSLYFLLYGIGSHMTDRQRDCSWLALLIPLGLWATTNLAYYTFSPMAHAASFMMVSLFLLCWWHTKDNDRYVLWFVLGVSGAMVVLCRWQGGLFILVPVVYELIHLPAKLRDREKPFAVKVWFISRGLAVVAYMVMMIPQLMQLYAIYGSVIQHSAVNYVAVNRLAFPPPYFLKVLFSTNHGWLIWTPIVLLGILGLLYGVIKYPKYLAPLLFVVVLQVLLVGSLTVYWEGGDAFGMRYLIGCIPIIGVGIFVWLLNLHQRYYYVICLFAVSCFVYTSLFAVQFRLYLLPRKGPLSLQELVMDKIDIRTAIKRRQALLKARKLLAQQQPQEAIAVARQSVEKYQANQALFNLLLHSYEKTGQVAKAKKIKQEMDAWNKGLLF